MKKACYLLALSLLGAASAQAKTVDETTAKTIGYNFYRSVGTVKNASDMALAYKATGTVKGNEIVTFYVFNINSANGFVIVSGDDNVEPVLGYSKTSRFDINNMAPQARNWVTGYKNQISRVVENNLPPSARTATQWGDLKNGYSLKGAKTTDVSPMLATTWDQEPFYNVYCPYDYTYSKRTAAGCVATAMAQLMKYWSWPISGCGSHSYTDGAYGTLSTDFSKAYSWSTMPDHLTMNNFPLARLISDVGISVDMSYGTDATDGSGAFVIAAESAGINCAEHALKTYFHYSRSLKGVARFGISGVGAYDEATWMGLILAELNAGRPVIYSGAGAVGAHCWLADGYQTVSATTYLHFNFGWGGVSDGYYSIDSIAPAALGVGGGGGDFNSDQCALLGVAPDSFPNTPGSMNLLAHLHASNSPCGYNQPFSVTTKIHNAGSSVFSGDFCAQVFDTTNTLVGTVQTLTGETVNAGDSTASLTFSTTGMASMIPGTYSIRIMYRNSSSSDWTPIANNDTFINYSMVDVYDVQNIALYSDLTVTSGTPMVSGSAATLLTSLINLGSSAFSGSLQAEMYNISDGSAYTFDLLTGQHIAGDYAHFTFHFSTSSLSVPAGTYALVLQSQPGGTGAFSTIGSTYYTNPILVTVTGTTGVPQTAPVDNISVYPNPASESVTVDMPGTAVSSIRIADMRGRTMKIVQPDGSIKMNIGVSDLAAGVYFMQLQTGQGTITKKIVVAR